MIVIADASPIHYLVLIGRVHLLEELYGSVALPSAVRSELLHPSAPDIVRAFMQSPPTWIAITDPGQTRPLHPDIGRGELEAINLALEWLAADPLRVMDDREGMALARSVGPRCIGTLAELGLAAERGPTRFDQDLAALRATNTRLPKNVGRE
jgi:predicted nucleic acid-binding protein